MTNSGITYLLWHDLVGVTRTRGVPSRDIERRYASGLGWARAGQALTAFGNIVENSWGPMDEVRQIPDPTAHFTIPGRGDWPDFQAVICNSMADQVTPWECCGRSFFQAALDALHDETGLTIFASFEHEFLVAGEGFVPSAPFSMAAARQKNDYLTDLEAALTSTGVTTYTIEPEYGTGQYEVACAPELGLRAADACLIARETIREVSRQHGLTASFSPKPAREAVGNGAHIHLSLVQPDGTNTTYDPSGPMNLSPVAAAFCAGVLEHLDALLAITAPAPVSYFRLGPHHWSTGYRAIGLQNREAALRITPGVGDQNVQRKGHNIEYRPCDGIASPYLALGALVWAGLDGIRRGLVCPNGISVDPADMTDAERDAAGVKALNSSLGASLDALLADEIACSWFKGEMLPTYLALKRWEIAAAAEAGEDATFSRYRAAY